MATSGLPESWLLSAFRTGGVDTDLLCDRLPGETEQLLGVPELLSPDQVNLILTECEKLTGDTHFGLHMVDYVNISMLGIYGYLLTSAPTVRRLLETAQRYYPTVWLGGTLKLTVSDTVCVSANRLSHRGAVSARHHNEWTLGFFVDFIQSRLDTDWHPTRVRFSNSAPDDSGELHRLFGNNISFRQRTNSFEFDPVLLDRRINDADPRLLSILMRHADELLLALAEEESFEAQVRLAILEKMKHGLPTAETIAQLNAMSLSAFKRRLQNEGLSYRSLRDDVTREVSQRLLRDTDLSIGTIALEVGYSEHSAFDRAFARISGMTPIEYRRSAKRSGAKPGRQSSGLVLPEPLSVEHEERQHPDSPAMSPSIRLY